MTQDGTWVSYSGSGRIILACVLLAAAAGVTYAATRLPRPVRPARSGEAAANPMFVTWGFAIAAFAGCAAVYVKADRREHVFHAPPVDPITPVTLSCVGIIFVVILLISARSLGSGVALGSATLGALAAPMISSFRSTSSSWSEPTRRFRPIQPCTGSCSSRPCSSSKSSPWRC